MHPELFHFTLPSFFSDFLQIGEVVIYSYAFCVVIGTIFSVAYTKWAARKYLGIRNISHKFFYTIFLCGFVGGKIFYYLAHPMIYIHEPRLLLDNFSGGFVFYGSFVTAIIYVVWYLRKLKIPLLPMLDILAITTLIAHSFGRIGCFLAGCCYGLPTESRFGFKFPNTYLETVHPTQLYEAIALIFIMIGLLILSRYKKFDGQIFLGYVCFYALFRIFIEFIRGDDRGYIFSGLISPSQFIAMLLISISLFFYFKLNNIQKTNF